MRSKKNKELLLLSEISSLIGSTLDMREIYGRLVKSVIRAIDVDRGILLIYNDQKKVLEAVAWHGAADKDVRGMSLPVANSVFGRIYKSGKPKLVPHTTRQTEYVRRLGAGAYIAVPMRAREKFIGLMAMDNGISGRTIEDLDEALLVAIAGQLAAAIENARLYEDAQAKVKELRHLNRVASLGALAAGVAHNIKNPLTAMKMAVQMAELYPDKGQFWAEYGALIGEEIRRLEDTVENFLGFARGLEVKMQALDLSVLIQKVLDLLLVQARQAGAEIVVNLPAPIMVMADQQTFRQVIVNLLLNAIEALPKGRKGRVEISATADQIKDTALITISDNGCGISRENQKKLFTPFFTTKPKGNGIGLADVHRIIEEHQGRIKVISEMGKGTAFTIEIPLAK
ncbi:hypothetical protein NO2_1316 [Candidatus Termititenax persephonae]|uniref:histidine kinase n=1 Tax=Candidatus Termititenax persephonae TaxID=2218525 RepID=A0A388TK12_9BACT|nr:hypothetical protein NO2_1316 [Candidatus Termititenax persephonae]